MATHADTDGFSPQQARQIELPPAPPQPLGCIEVLRRYGRSNMRFVLARSVRLLVDAAEAFPQMLAAIDAAAVSVDMESYLLRDDAAGAKFQQALIRAAGRGVRVRLVYDWLGSFSLPGRFVRELTDAGAAVRAYHPLVLLRPVWALNHRDHRKILVVDEQVSFTGGLNIGMEYAPRSDGGGGWRDTHLRVDGPEAARELTALFTRAWMRARPHGQPPSLRRLRQRFSRPSANHKPHRSAADVCSVGDGGVPVAIIGNERLSRRRRIHRAYLRAISAAERYVLIENAYFIPSRDVRRALIRAAGRGVVVAVVVAAHSDVPLAAWAGQWWWEELLAGGVRLFQWPCGMMHAKTAVIDDAWAIVGSYNFDRRSLLHQLESVAVVADAGLAARLRDQTLLDIARCREVDLDTHRRRPWRHKVWEYLAYLLRPWL